jgi:uncharacterized protein (TIGR02118 family)
MKSVCLLSRKPGSSREAFRTYYEERHALLGMRYFPFSKYVRNHVVSASRPIDFDCVSEFYVPDIAKSVQVLAGPVGAIMDADEKRFMDQSLLRPAASEETILYGPARGPARADSRRVMVMMHRPDVAALRDWASLFGAAEAGVARVSLDNATSFTERSRAFPFDAVLSLWLTPGAPLPDDSTLAVLRPTVTVITEVCESEPEQLAALYRPA